MLEGWCSCPFLFWQVFTPIFATSFTVSSLSLLAGFRNINLFDDFDLIMDVLMYQNIELYIIITDSQTGCQLEWMLAMLVMQVPNLDLSGLFLLTQKIFCMYVSNFLRPSVWYLCKINCQEFLILSCPFPLFRCVIMPFLFIWGLSSCLSKNCLRLWLLIYIN